MDELLSSDDAPREEQREEPEASPTDATNLAKDSSDDDIDHELGSTSSNMHDGETTADTNPNWKVPYFFVLNTRDINNDEGTSKFLDEHLIVGKPIHKVLQSYERESYVLLKQLEHAELVARESERTVLTFEGYAFYETLMKRSMADKISLKRGKLAQALEEDLMTLRRLLSQFQLTWALASSSVSPTSFDENVSSKMQSRFHHHKKKCTAKGEKKDSPHNNQNNEQTRFVMKQSGWKGNNDENNNKLTVEEAYGSATSLVAHITRDWTIAGRSIRVSLYDWCIKMLWEHLQFTPSEDHDERECNDNDNNNANNGNVNTTNMPEPVHILVPGSGLGRLAYDITQHYHPRLYNHMTESGSKCNNSSCSQKQEQVDDNRDVKADHYNDGTNNNKPFSSSKALPVHVEANDASIVMAAASYPFVNEPPRHRHQCRQGHQCKSNDYFEKKNVDESENNTENYCKNDQTDCFFGRIHPYAADPFGNEIFEDLRTDYVVSFPDHDDYYFSNEEDVRRVPKNVMSYTIGDFVQIYSSTEYKHKFHSIVTCFFIDTASNIYEYIAIVRHILKRSGGIWINVGPLQWHRNAMVHPTAQELRDMLEHLFGFEVLVWQLDTTLLPYRSSDVLFNTTKDQDHRESKSVKQEEEPTRLFTRQEGYYPLRFVLRLQDESSATTTSWHNPPQERSAGNENNFDNDNDDFFNIIHENQQNIKRLS